VEAKTGSRSPRGLRVENPELAELPAPRPFHRYQTAHYRSRSQAPVLLFPAEVDPPPPPRPLQRRCLAPRAGDSRLARPRTFSSSSPVAQHMRVWPVRAADLAALPRGFLSWRCQAGFPETLGGRRLRSRRLEPPFRTRGYSLR
jgi:hypothetical protein